MTKHRCTSRIDGEGKSPVSRSSASRRCCCCGGGGRASLCVILRVYVRTRLSLFCDIRFPNSPHSIRGATERKHLDILEYEHCVNIRSVLSALSPLPLPLSISLSLSLFLSLSPLFVSLASSISFRVSLFFNARITGWAALRSMESFPQFSGVPRLPVMGDYGPRAENETFSLFS